MVLVIVCIGVLVILGATVVAARYLRQDGRVRNADTLPVVTAMAVIGCVLLVVALQLGVQPGKDLKTVLTTGVVGAGVITMVFAVWLNHRRYRVEEARQQVERDKADLEQRRHRLEQEKFELEHAKDRREHDQAAGEVVIRAVELFGHADARVRGGTLHTLAGLAAQRPDRAQEVADLVCMYLRNQPGGADAAAGEAQKVLLRLVKQANTATPPVEHLDLDLTGARLTDFVLEDVVVRSLTLAGAHLAGATSLRGLGSVAGTVRHGQTRCRVTLDDAVFSGDVWLHRARLRRLSARGAEFAEDVSMEGSYVELDVVLSDGSVAGDADFSGAEFGTLMCSAVTFGEKVSFRRVILRGGATFLQTRFGRADFEKFACPHSVVFDEAHFAEAPRLHPNGGMPLVSLRKTTLSAKAAADDQLRLPPHWHVRGGDRDDLRYLVAS